LFLFYYKIVPSWSNSARRIAMGSGCDATDEAPNGSKAVTLLLRLSTMALALTSAVVMATANECSIYETHGARVTVTFKNYPPFV